MKRVVANFLKNGEIIAEEFQDYRSLKNDFDNLEDDDWLTTLQDYVKSVILAMLSPLTKVIKIEKNGKVLILAKGRVYYLPDTLN